MKAFRYEGLSASGATVEGVVEAADRDDAARKAREYCRVLVKIEPVSAGKMNDIMNADIGLLLSGGKIKPKKLALLSSQLAIELKAGLPLVRSLRLVAENEEDKNLKKILEDVADDVQAGHGLAKSFQTRAPKLPSTFIETIRAGEASGRLDDAFARLKVYFENADAIASKVGSAMIYPAMLIAVAIVVVVIIMVFAVPVFEDSFASMGNDLPLPTKMLIGMSNFMTDNALLLIAILAIIAISVILFGKSETGRHTYARLALTFPGIELVNRMSAASQFASTLSTMMESGLPLVQATRITAATAENLLISEEIENAVKGVLEGHTLSRGLRHSKYLPPLLVEMTSVGEETGHLEETLTVVSEYYNKEVDTAVKRALGILEPCITIVLALLVVFILLSVYLPIFTMYGSV